MKAGGGKSVKLFPGKEGPGAGGWDPPIVDSGAGGKGGKKREIKKRGVHLGPSGGGGSPKRGGALSRLGGKMGEKGKKKGCQINNCQSGHGCGEMGVGGKVRRCGVTGGGFWGGTKKR